MAETQKPTREEFARYKGDGKEAVFICRDDSCAYQEGVWLYLKFPTLNNPDVFVRQKGGSSIVELLDCPINRISFTSEGLLMSRTYTEIRELKEGKFPYTSSRARLEERGMLVPCIKQGL